MNSLPEYQPETHIFTGKKAIALLSALALFACSKSLAGNHEQLEKAAAQGDAKAQCQLGMSYAVVQADAKAVEWYQRAAAQGDDLAQLGLGSMYAKGRGIRQDFTKAAELYQKSAAQGNSAAQYELGLMYAAGIGVLKNEAEAIEWWQKAAAQGNIEAQYFLGRMYLAGTGAPKDEVRAYAWFNLVAAQNDIWHPQYQQAAAEKRDGLEKQLTLEQKGQAQKLSAELFAKMPKK